MMCLACRQDAIWRAYLESRGLPKPDDPAAVEALFGAFPVPPPPAPPPVQQEQGEQAVTAPAKICEKNSFSCDVPTASAADLKFLQSSRKLE
jgi:hypothetical protein